MLSGAKHDRPVGSCKLDSVLRGSVLVDYFGNLHYRVRSLHPHKCILITHVSYVSIEMLLCVLIRKIGNEQKKRNSQRIQGAQTPWRCILHGGVYSITNTLNGKYLIGYAANLKSVQNHFQFALATGSTVHPRLRKDWEELGATAFTLEVLEELEQKPEQSEAEFIDGLKTLEHLWRANLDASKEY